MIAHEAMVDREARQLAQAGRVKLRMAAGDGGPPDERLKRNLRRRRGEPARSGEVESGMPETVYLLGAGFARAISRRMPLLQELGERVQAAVGRGREIPAPVTAMMAENFAHALSYLEQAKPWVTEADNLRHRALYLDLSNAIARDLEDTAQAIGREARAVPRWAGALVRHWHERRSVVVTLNYDTLIEAMAAGMEPGAADGIATQDIYPPLLTDAGLRSGEKRPEPRKPSFRLLKLHGSTNWYYSGRAAAYGEPIYFVPPLVTRRADERDRRQHEARLRAVADKYPFLVPPIYDKSPLLTHETIRALWFEAGEALRGARRVVCMGYSLPESDLTMNHFLRTTCAKRAEFVIVDPAADVERRFQRLFKGMPVRVTRFAAAGKGIAEFVERETAGRAQASGASKAKARGRRRKPAASKR